MRISHIIVFCFVTLCCSCQTLVSTNRTELASSSLKQFGNCWKNDGSVNFKAFKNDQPILSAMLDWIREEKGQWRWEVYDPLGRTLLAGEVTDGKLHTSGMDLSKLRIEKEGFFNYDGTILPIKWKEVHCFLNFLLPEQWLDLKLSTDKHQAASAKHIYFEDRDRNIEVYFEQDKTCGAVNTSFMGIFRRERFTWCFLRKPKFAHLVFEKIFRFEWTSAEEKENEWTSYSK